jgi:hypothetical protein
VAIKQLTPDQDKSIQSEISPEKKELFPDSELQQEHTQDSSETTGYTYGQQKKNIITCLMS